MSIRLLLLFLLAGTACLSQEGEFRGGYTLDANAYYGSILLHNTDISHLITNHPAGLILGISKKTFGQQRWQSRFNYPDTGYSFVYQQLNNPSLGEIFGLYAHYNFYFLKRNLQLRLGQGLAYSTNPYDKQENFRNNAYGTALLSSTYLMLNYHREELYKGLGFQAGISLMHYSNANIKAPNTSTNTFAFNYGLVYTLDNQERNFVPLRKDSLNYKEPLHFNVVFRTGINESDVINSGQYPFYIFSAYSDKRLGRFSALQLGADLFFSNFLKELIRFQAVSFPEMGVSGKEDFKRVGVFLGHELFINRMSLLTQLGYYIYYPFDFEGRVYNRIGLKRYFGDSWFGAITLKSHAAKAEAVEFGLGVRL